MSGLNNGEPNVEFSTSTADRVCRGDETEPAETTASGTHPGAGFVWRRWWHNWFAARHPLVRATGGSVVRLAPAPGMARRGLTTRAGPLLFPRS